ncbi:hypothetical protein JW613_33560 [Streptomyces smyrnaeus]|uniref:Uncharacterized protein n=1 Tax=Streptomyces smyrnaeus TaxID=1387713 RepID=A0ABS3Y6A7_9ACTN|nr:hypothetical protein [Streptomyces smyrnaeus]MBO8203171.1 hypothetical protein [Streptomyces smyrnaeus]
MPVHISSDIREHIGEAEADRFARSRIYTCTQCGTAGDASREPAIATLAVSPELSHLGIAHQRCAPTEVIRHYPSGHLKPATRTDLIPRAIGIPSPDGTRPGLLLAWEETVMLLPAEGEAAAPVLQYLLNQGLHRLSALGKTPPPCPGWLVRQGPGEALQVDGPGNRHLEDGRMTAPTTWRSLVATAGEVMLLMGQLDLETLYAAEPPWSSYQQALREGRLLAGTVPVTLL